MHQEVSSGVNTLVRVITKNDDKKISKLLIVVRGLDATEYKPSTVIMQKNLTSY